MVELGNQRWGVKDKNRNSGFLTKCVVTGDKGKDVAGVPGALKKKSEFSFGHVESEGVMRLPRVLKPQMYAPPSINEQ